MVVKRFLDRAKGPRVTAILRRFEADPRHRCQSPGCGFHGDFNSHRSPDQGQLGAATLLTKSRSLTQHRHNRIGSWLKVDQFVGQLVAAELHSASRFIT